MNKQEVIKSTEKLLNNISVQSILPGERTSIYTLKLKHLADAIKSLPEDNQKIIIYKYFESKKNVEIARILRANTKVVTRRVDKLVLEIGRIIFGIEDEFFREICIMEQGDNKTDDQVLMEILG